jgi:hypothetical protein
VRRPRGLDNAVGPTAVAAPHLTIHTNHCGPDRARNFESGVADALCPDAWCLTKWLRVGDRYVKTDALDHHRDHFLPGMTDAAWDIASATVEWQLDDRARHLLIAAHLAACGDHQIVRRLPFYTAAYAAFRVGYATMAADILGNSADGRRFRRAAQRYTSALKRAVMSGSSAR